MRGRGRWQLLSGLWLLFLLVYLVWGGIAQAGLYYWVGTLEVDHFGSYEPMLTGVVPGLLLALPALWFLGREARRQRQAPPLDPPQAGQARRRVAIPLCLTGAVALAAAIGFYFAAQAQPGGGGTAIRLDPATLGAGPARASRVTIAGRVDEAIELRIREGSRGSTWTTIYSAFRPDGEAAKGAPLRLFVERRENGGSDGAVILADREEEGYLVENGLPSLVRYAFEHQGARIASPHYLLRTGSSALRTPYYVGAALTTFFGCLLIGLGALLLVLPGRGGGGTIAEGRS
jgi:hypothetical protein